MFSSLIEKLQRREDLTVDEASAAMGEIMDVRRIYTASAKIRRALNNQPQREPTSADEVLALPEGEESARVHHLPA